MKKNYKIYSKIFNPGCYFWYFLPLLFQLTILSAQEPLYIAYTANLNGNIELCRCKPDEMGSIAQLSGMIDSLKNKHPELLLLDNGDFYKTYPCFL